MRLGHSQWTTGDAAKEDNPDFICQLVNYFKEDTPARTWFQLYALDRRRLKKKLSWNLLVKRLRKDYSIFSRPGVLFKRYWELKQGKRSVQSYITEKKSAAMQLKTELSDEIMVFGFIEGLNTATRNYVNLQKPKSIAQAQKFALSYEESMIDLDRVPTNRASNSKGDKRKRGDGVGNKTCKLNLNQKVALEKLRELRRNKCFRCGSGQHDRDNCNATSTDCDKHREEVNRLKTAINTAE